MESFRTYWILVPIVASVIGYSTNWVAIKMLFRPLREKRILGFRVPFTPGLVPRRKDEIAENIGEAVAEHLVTSEAIEGRLSTPEVKTGLKKTINRWLDRELSKERGKVDDMLPPDYCSRFDALQAELTERLTTYVLGFLESEDCKRTLDRLLEVAGESLEDKVMGDLIAEETGEELARRAENLMIEFTEGKKFERGTKAFWLKKIREFDRREGEVSSLFSDSFIVFLVEQTRKWIPTLIKKGVDLLDNPEFRDRVKEFLKDFLGEKLRESYDEESIWDQVKYGFVEIFVMGNQNLDSKIDEAIDEGFPRLMETLEQEEVREEIGDYGVKTLNNLLDREISEYQLSSANKRKLASLLTVVTVEIARNSRVRAAVRSLIRGMIEEVRGKRVNEVLDLEEEESNLADGLYGLISEIASSKEGKERVRSLIDEAVSRLRNKQLGKISRWISPDDVDPLITLIIERSTGSISAEISEILSVIDVRSLVKKEVNNFSTLEVEKLVLGVTGNQLRAITWFGALLGFVIGVVQLAVVVLGG